MERETALEMIINGFIGPNSVFQTPVATGFTWGMTALGSGMIFMFKDVNRRVMDCMLGFAPWCKTV
ncbi:hypothetical protein JW906_04215 [bacterium]|nr:hypothetical protein [bacterium]